MLAEPLSVARLTAKGSHFMQINLTFDQPTSSLPAGFLGALNICVQYLDHELTNNITVKIDVGYGTYDGGITVNPLGIENDFGPPNTSTTNDITVSYATLRSALLSHVVSPDDASSVN